MTLLTCGTPLSAQAVLESPQGRIEVVGLRQWTLRMLEDSLAAKAPGESLRSHACAAILQERLGFPAAAVNFEMSAAAPGTKPTTSILITLVEPQDSARVQFRRVVGTQRLAPDRWAPLRQATRDSTGLRLNELLFAMQFYGLYRSAPDSASALIGQFAPGMVTEARIIWSAVSRLTAAPELSVALGAARGDTNWQHRVLAVTVLANFAARDEAWHALAAALRDPEERVRSAAAAVLRTLAQSAARPVDWRPARSDLRALLGGTNVWDYRTLLTVLTKTKIDPQLSPMLLRGNADLLVAHLRADGMQAREPAMAAVRQMSGRAALSRDGAIAWVAGL